MGDQWELYEDKRGLHRWRRRGRNHEIVGRSSEGYVSKAACKANAQRHLMDDNPDGLGRNDKWESYKDKRGEFRWRRMASNGRITGTSSEGYVSKAACEANAKRNGKL